MLIRVGFTNKQAGSLRTAPIVFDLDIYSRVFAPRVVWPNCRAPLVGARSSQVVRQ
jgi:hypothetical protein